MTVLIEGPLCLKIHLNKYELKKYFSGYSKINLEDSNTRKTITTLFNIAVNRSDFDLEGKRTIEIFPTASGGCILKLTTITPGPQVQTNKNVKNIRLKSSKKQNSPYIFCFKNFDNLLSVITELYKCEKTKNYISALHFANNKYFLKITLPLFDVKTGILINEFCEYSTKGKFAESKLDEYSKELIKENAIKILGKYFLNH